ncbi:hypothetical protein [Ferribacterium limneticum]|uniref:hypothetical protein n=1 Tax=Ferribacterium limneticum TaxID=76259 RepID=UPI001CF85780|nr:hypothetical protein [Ferribacterium limneticum]UCV22556.1 hypothetical protein KI613_18915 [Ferribacterium limneticum]
MFNAGSPSRLAYFSSSITELLATKPSNGHYILVQAINIFERNGCGPAVSLNPEQQVRPLKVFAFDLVWLSPGPTGTWSQDGKQVCYCVTHGTDKDNWYRTALQRFFASGDQRSLLSFKDIYSRRFYIDMCALDHESAAPIPSCPEHTPEVVTWADSFRPDPSLGQTVESGEARFATFTAEVTGAMAAEFGHAPDADTRLVWIYYSGGPDKESETPPLWAASMFVVLKLDRQRDDTPESYKRDFDSALSNLLACLQEATQATLHHGQVKNQIAQTLTHEFKNTIQAISILSNDLLIDARNALPNAEALDQFSDKLETLNWEVATTSAMTQAMYWLADQNPKRIPFTSDPDATTTRYALYLAVHMVARTKAYWTLTNMPSLRECEDYFRSYFAMKGRRSPYALLENLRMIVLLFFVLPPVRNIRAHNNAPGMPGIEIFVSGHDNVLNIHQISIETAACNETFFSKSVAAMMRMVKESFHEQGGRIIDVDPHVQSQSRALADGTFRVERITTLTAYTIPARY